MTRLKGCGRAFAGGNSGTVSIIFAVSCIVLMLLIGVAVDTARYHNVSLRLQAALDGASLAAAKLLSDPNVVDDEIKDRAASYFTAAVQTFGVLPSHITPVTVVIDRNNASVEVQGRVDVPAYFGGFANLPSLTAINQKSKVVYDITNVELSMVLDITGSMNDNNKLADMKQAAKDVVDTLFDGALNDDNVRIALAPYSASVNAGPYATAVSAAPATTATTCGWSWHGYNCSSTTTAGTPADTCTIGRPASKADAAPSGADRLLNIADPIPANEQFYYSCPPSVVLPLTNRSQRDNLKATIDSYAAVGGTAGHLGTAWGWYLLSPNWSSVFPSESAPKAYGDTRAQKAMIVMTDGIFNVSYESGAPFGDAQLAQDAYDDFDALCSGAKAAGVTIYTVGFDLNDATALSHLESCASSPGAFYDAKTGAQLKDAFRDIAGKLGNLRVAS